MKRYVWILLCGAFLAPPSLALKQGERGLAAQELSDELGSLVERAISEGLLSPAGPRGQAAPLNLQPSSEPELAPGTLRINCEAGYPLEFNDYRQMAAYQDFLNYRQEGESANASGQNIARAYIALDLSSEALINLRGMSDHEAEALRQLARLLEARHVPNTDYFRDLAACHDGAGLWLALAQLAGGQGEGAGLLDQHVQSFRQLPPQLRERYAMLAVPALDARGERLLAEKLFSGFSPAEIQNSSQLQLTEAVLRLGKGDPNAETALRNFLMQGRYQETALFALLRHGRTITELERNILVSGLLIRLEQSHQDTDIRGSLQFVLEELSTGSRHQTILDMATRPNLQSEAAQDEIRRHFVAALERDLANSDPLRNMAAIEALVREDGLLDGVEARGELYEAAVLKSVRLGFGTLADTLARKANPGAPVSEERAVLAYHRGEADALQAKATDYPGNLRVVRMAALNALNAGDKPRLAELSAGLIGDPVSLIALIEEDAALGAWIVPNTVYTAASALTGDDDRRRVRRVMDLRRIAGGFPAPPDIVTVTGMPETLLRSRLALDTMPGGER